MTTATTTTLAQSFPDKTRGIVCHTATGQDCLANATRCVYRNGAHFNRPSFAATFPMTREIADFFARDACAINGGDWSTIQQQCICKTTTRNKEGAYCLARGQDLSLNNEKLPSLVSSAASHSSASDYLDFPNQSDKTAISGGLTFCFVVLLGLLLITARVVAKNY